MIGRKQRPTARLAGAAQALTGVVDPLVRDEKLRRRLLAGITAGAAARRRVERQTGLSGLARRLATDRVLRAQLQEMTRQLRKAERRAETVRRHRLRNGLLVAAGVGAAAVTAAAWMRGGDAGPDGKES
jgi:hypothetical protein